MPDEKKLAALIERLEERVANEDARSEEILQRLRERDQAPLTASEAAAQARQRLRDGYAQIDAAREAAAKGEGDDDE